MTSISYEDVFSYFLGNITDYQIAELEEDTANEVMKEYLQKTLADPKIYTIFSSISLGTDSIDFEMDYEVDGGVDKYFVINILSKGMVCEWVRPQVRSKINLAQYFGGKEQTFFSQANHIGELRGLLEDTEVEIDRLLKARGYIDNEYLKDKNEL